MSNPRAEDLIPGKRYEITLEDCCIQGTLFGTFLHPNAFQDEDGFIYDWEYHFDIGVLGPCWGQWTTKEIENEPL